MKVLLLVIYSVIYSVTGNPCSGVERLNITEGVLLNNDSVVYEGVVYDKGTWYDEENENGTTRYGCPCIGRICIWKCCSPGQYYLDMTCSKMDSQDVFSPPVYYIGKQPSLVKAHEHFFTMYGRPCESMYPVDQYFADEEFYIQENGTLYEIVKGVQQWHDSNRYCVEWAHDRNSSLEARLLAGVCFPIAAAEVTILNTLYAAGLLLSVPFLLATILVYALIPELRNLHGMCLMAYCSGLMIAYIFLSYLMLHTGEVSTGMSGCVIIAFIVYYAFQTSFFWLNVMCFDIWRTFSGYRGGSTHKRRENRRFALYGSYAWGIPVVLTAITAFMQFNDNLPEYIIRPRFGAKRCWFEDWKGDLLYFYGPVLILIACNTVFFTVTAYRIFAIRQETAILKGAESSRSDRMKRDKQRYSLYLKLFVVMGVNWSAELISFVVGGSNLNWILLDLCNVILGILIFIIAVCKKKVFNLIKKRFHHLFGLPQTQTDTRSPWLASSSAHTDDTRISSDDAPLRLKEMH